MIYTKEQIAEVDYLQEIDIAVNGNWVGFCDTYGYMLRRMNNGEALTKYDKQSLIEDVECIKDDMENGLLFEQDEKNRLSVLESIIDMQP